MGKKLYTQIESTVSLPNVHVEIWSFSLEYSRPDILIEIRTIFKFPLFIHTWLLRAWALSTLTYYKPLLTPEFFNS